MLIAFVRFLAYRLGRAAAFLQSSSLTVPYPFVKKQIAGAALDVFECEPLIDCDIKDHMSLRKMPNVILTPHIASATREARDEMAATAAKNIVAVLTGKKALTAVTQTR